MNDFGAEKFDRGNRVLALTILVVSRPQCISNLASVLVPCEENPVLRFRESFGV